MAKRGPGESGRPLLAGQLAEPRRQGPCVVEGDTLHPMQVSASTEVDVDLSLSAGVLEASGSVARALCFAVEETDIQEKDNQHAYVNGVPTVRAKPQHGLGEWGANRAPAAMQPSHKLVSRILHAGATPSWEHWQCHQSDGAASCQIERSEAKQREGSVHRSGECS